MWLKHKLSKCPNCGGGGWENQTGEFVIAEKSLCGADSHSMCGAATTPPPPHQTSLSSQALSNMSNPDANKSVFKDPSDIEMEDLYPAV